VKRAYIFEIGLLLVVGGGPVFAGGIERGSQFLGPLFEEGNYLELSYGHVSPSASGRDITPFGVGASTGNILGSYNSFGFAYKRLCCTNPVWDSSHESSVVAGIHEQTYTPDLQDQELASLQ
jgi:hypothetical protein